MKVKLLNLAHKYGMKDGKRWDLTVLHVKHEDNVAEVKVWKDLSGYAPLVNKDVELVFEGRYNFKNRSFYGSVVDLAVGD